MSGLRSLSCVHRLAQNLHRLTLADNLQHLSHRCLASQGCANNPQFPKTNVLPLLNQNGKTPTEISNPHLLTRQTASSRQQCNKVEKEYICPSRLTFNQPSLVILDKSISGLGVLDCPTLPQALRDVIAPKGRIQIISDPKTHDQPAKEAKNILKIRRKKMNRHLLKKFHKRMLFTLRKQRQQRRKKKENVFNAEMKAIWKKAEDFDAEQHIRNELEEARRGGFYVNILASNKSR